MNIAILGPGNIGGTLGKKWAAAGHQVRFGARQPDDPKYSSLLEGIQGEASVVTIDAALAFGQVVLLAIPGGAVSEMMAKLGGRLNGKIIIDATNRVGQADMSNFAAISVGAPEASLYRAFSTLGWENFETPKLGGQQIDLFYCGDAGDTRTAVEGLIADVGLRPVYVGGREQVGVIDGLTRLWFALAMGQGRGRRLAFKMISD